MFPVNRTKNISSAFFLSMVSKNIVLTAIHSTKSEDHGSRQSAIPVNAEQPTVSETAINTTVTT
jgi:V8-like Glu-specific endopeptidase